MGARKRRAAKIPADAQQTEARDWDLPATQKEIEANERAKGLRCRGPNKSALSPLDYDHLAPAVQKALDKLPKPKKGEKPLPPTELVQALLATGRMNEARSLDESTREGCGYDVSELVLKHPFDGRTHQENCPRCGQLITFASPVYNVKGGTG